MNGPERPILRYHGGKWLLAPWIISNFPAHRVYVEPYGGAASVLLQKPRSYGEVYNELDGEIVNLFTVIREQPRRLMRALAWTPFSRVEFNTSYETDPDPVEQARRTVIRSFMGFGSTAASGNKTGFRSNSNRSGTTPAHDWANFPRNIRPVSRRLRGVVIENKPAIEVIKTHDSPETLHYVDPPYVHSTRKAGNVYCKKGYRFEMSDDQHLELSNALRGVSGMVVLSGYHSELYDDLYSGWEREERQTFGDGACPRTEVLWFNPAAWSALHAKEESLFTGAA